MSCGDASFLDFVSDQVTIDLNMLGALMQNGVNNDVKGCLVVILEKSSLRM